MVRPTICQQLKANECKAHQRLKILLSRIDLFGFLNVQSQPNAIPLGLKFYNSLGNNGITEIFGRINVRNFPKTDSAKYLCNAIISPCFIKFSPQ